MNDVEIVDGRDLRCGDKTGHDRDDRTHAERASGKAGYLFQIEVPALWRRFPKNFECFGELFDLFAQRGLLRLLLRLLFFRSHKILLVIALPCARAYTNYIRRARECQDKVKYKSA